MQMTISLHIFYKIIFYRFCFHLFGGRISKKYTELKFLMFGLKKEYVYFRNSFISYKIIKNYEYWELCGMPIIVSCSFPQQHIVIF